MPEQYTQHLSFPLSRDEIGSVILALDIGIASLATQEFRDDASNVRTRLVELLKERMANEQHP